MVARAFDFDEDGWVAIAKDTKILERPDELAALLRARIHIIFYPGNARRAELVEIAAATLAEVCAMASFAGGGVWRVRGGGRPRLELIDI